MMPHLGAERAQQFHLLRRLGVRHVDDAAVAARIADVGEADAGVAGRALDHVPPGEQAAAFGSPIIPSAARSFTEPPGFRNSALPRISQPVSSLKELRRMSGVLPMASERDWRMGMERPRREATCYASPRGSGRRPATRLYPDRPAHDQESATFSTSLPVFSPREQLQQRLGKGLEALDDVLARLAACPPPSSRPSRAPPRRSGRRSRTPPCPLMRARLTSSDM